MGEGEGEVLPPWTHAAAATETRVRLCEKETITSVKKPSGSSRSVRIHGNLILSHGTRRVGQRSSSSSVVDVTHQVAVELDHRSEDVRPAAFTCVDSCSELVHDMLATKVLAATGGFYDLAAAGNNNWVDSTRTPLDVATAIVQQVRHEYADDVPADLELDVHLPELRVTLAYSEPKALLLACKDAEAAARGRNRKRRRGPDGGELLCPICMLETEEEEETVVRLPCSHPFHCSCLETWFHGAPTCPTCRRDIMACFSSVVVRAAAPPERSGDENEMATLWDSVGDESEYDLVGDETILDDASQVQLFGDESEYELGDETILDDASQVQLPSSSEEFGDETLLDDISSEGKQFISSGMQLSGDEYRDEALLAEGEQSIPSEEIQLFRDESGDGALVVVDDVAKAEQYEHKILSPDVDIAKGE